MATRKSTPVIVIGIAVFVVGAALAFIVLRGHNKKAAAKTPTNTVTTAAAPVGGVAVGPVQASIAPPTFSFTIPPGKNAVPVQVGQLQGLDGLAKAGDIVNIFANVSKGRINTPGLGIPLTKLVATNVQVLAVLSGPPSAAPSGTAVYVLALDPGQAEQIIFFSTYESLYLTLVPKNSAPAGTPGRSYQNAI